MNSLKRILFITTIIGLSSSKLIAQQSKLKTLELYSFASQLYDSADYQKSIDICNYALQGNKGEVDSLNYSFFFLKATCYYYLKDYQKSISNIDSVLKIEPNNSTNYLLKAECYSFLLLPKEAIKQINKAIKLDPENEVFYSTASQLYFQNEQYRKSLKSIKKAIKLNDKIVDFHFQMFRTYYFQNKYSRAINCLDESIKLDSKNGKYYYWRGICKYILGKFYCNDMKQSCLLNYKEGCEYYTGNCE